MIYELVILNDFDCQKRAASESATGRRGVVAAEQKEMPVFRFNVMRQN